MLKHKNPDWDQWADEKYHRYHLADIMKNKAEFYASIFKHHGIKSQTKSMLEIGCGFGKETLVFAMLFKKILAVDPTAVLIERFNKTILELKLEKSIQTKITDCASFKSRTKYDMVAFTKSFLWIDNQMPCLEKIPVKKNGHVLIIEPVWSTRRMLIKKTNPKMLTGQLDTMKTVTSSKKYDLIYFTVNFGTREMVYLLKRK